MSMLQVKQGKIVYPNGFSKFLKEYNKYNNILSQQQLYYTLRYIAGWDINPHYKAVKNNKAHMDVINALEAFKGEFKNSELATELNKMSSSFVFVNDKTCVELSIVSYGRLFMITSNDGYNFKGDFRFLKDYMHVFEEISQVIKGGKLLSTTGNGFHNHMRFVIEPYINYKADDNIVSNDSGNDGNDESIKIVVSRCYKASANGMVYYADSREEAVTGLMEKLS